MANQSTRRLHVPASGPGRIEALGRLATALRTELGDTGLTMLIALADELLQGDGEEARQAPAQCRATLDAPTPAPERDRAPTPAAARPLP